MLKYINSLISFNTNKLAITIILLITNTISHSPKLFLTSKNIKNFIIQPQIFFQTNYINYVTKYYTLKENCSNLKISLKMIILRQIWTINKFFIRAKFLFKTYIDKKALYE